MTRIVGYGVNGDPLQKGKLDLPELLEVPTPDEWAWAREFIARRRWQEAVTYRETAPHEYTIRELDRARRAGEPGLRPVRDLHPPVRLRRLLLPLRHLYWAVDEFKYWTMGWPVEETVVINRARVDAPEPWKVDPS